MTTKSIYWELLVKMRIKQVVLEKMRLIKRVRVKRCVGILLLLLVLVIPMQAVLAKGENNITTSGVLTHDEIWGGRIHVTGDVVVPEGITLAIEPGTVITFAPNRSDNDVKLPVLELLGNNKCNLVVKGNLRVEGEKDNKVIIGKLVYDLNTLTTISWGGVIFEGTNASSIIKHTEIRYADIALVYTGFSAARIINNTITDNDVGIMTFDFSAPRIDDNKVHNNNLRGISCYDYSFPMISHNTIESSDVGTGCEDSSFPIIQYNRFSDNSVGILIQGGSNPARVGNIFSSNTEAIQIEGPRNGR